MGLWSEGIFLFGDAGRLFTWLVDASAKTTVLLALALALSCVLKGCRPCVRYVLWRVAFVGILAIPLLSGLTPSFRLQILPVPAGGIRETARTVVTHGLDESVELSPRTHDDELAESPLKSPDFVAGLSRWSGFREWLWQSAAAWVIGLWFAGVSIVLARLMIGLWRAERLGATAAPLAGEDWPAMSARLAAQLGIRRKLRLLRHDGISVPFTWGVMRPTILLPKDAESWPGRRRYLVLAHELTHVRRYDWLVSLFAQVACAVYWFNPLVWVALRRVRTTGEQACDDGVLDLDVKRSEYAALLLETARSLALGLSQPAGTLAMTRGDGLEGRILSILHHDGNRRRASAAGATIVVTVCGMVLALAAVQLAPAAPDADVPAEYPVTVPASLDNMGGAVAQHMLGERSTERPNGNVDIRRDDGASRVSDQASTRPIASTLLYPPAPPLPPPPPAPAE